MISEGGGVMDMQNVATLIGSLGFPIVACIMLFWYINKRDDIHKEEINKLSEAVNNNTLVMQKLLDRLEE